MKAGFSPGQSEWEFFVFSFFFFFNRVDLEFYKQPVLWTNQSHEGNYYYFYLKTGKRNRDPNLLNESSSIRQLVIGLVTDLGFEPRPLALSSVFCPIHQAFYLVLLMEYFFYAFWMKPLFPMGRNFFFPPNEDLSLLII